MRWIIPFILLTLIFSCMSPAYTTHQVTFTEKPCIKPTEGYEYKTCSIMTVAVDNKIFKINKGFRSDLASIPRFYWSILSPRYSGLVYPGILHDYLYACPAGLSRRYADVVLYDALISEGISKYTAAKMYYAVRIFGGSHFQKDKYCIVNEDNK